ncbi:hypothetical protein JM946_12655 [Steroidobacter sp. S1-65]|uniref:ATP-binding protein n=1 Tax=Steroidobacter gossypii TaxID=2805490 RepID=A0ABS1WX93_9GAMM|nr:hypothetical protein [Steroidobacter gossypii]MBM0105609.1 hypothetical protein [Steroidobacter gossypii]
MQSGVRRKDGELILVAGASGSGKTLYSMRACAPAARLIVWDSHLEWWGRGCTPVRSISELARVLSTKEPGQWAYIGPVDSRSFTGFCRVALCAMKLEPCTIVVEELADVSTPAKAPKAWGELLRWARKLGCTVYGITQRPAESDKTLAGNATRIVCHALGSDLDAAYMTRYMPVSKERLLALDYERMEYLERLKNRTMRAGFNAPPAGGKKKKQSRSR